MPAFSDISVCAKEIPVVVDQPPLALWPGAISILVPPAVGILLPALNDLLRFFSGFHKFFRRLKFFLAPAGAASPIRKLKMRLIHDGFPVSAPF